MYPKAKFESFVSFGLDANKRISYFVTLLPKIFIYNIDSLYFNLDHAAL